MNRSSLIKFCRSISLIIVSALPLSHAQAGTFFSESFDGVSAPTLPAGWTTSSASGSNPFSTSTSLPQAGTNSIFIADPSTITDTRLTTPTISFVGISNAVLTFQNNFNLEFSFDGGVLEASIDGGLFSDILVLGGTFSSGAYNRTIGSNFGSPIGGRQAWSGNSNGYILSTVALPSTFNAHNVQLRWRLGTDNSVSGTGWHIDTVAITGDEANVPVPGSLALCGIALSALALIRRRKQV